jgi:hypothetical protein
MSQLNVTQKAGKRLFHTLVVVHLKSQSTFRVKKDSSVPLGMTLRGFVIPNGVRNLDQTELLPTRLDLAGTLF